LEAVAAAGDAICCGIRCFVQEEEIIKFQGYVFHVFPCCYGNYACGVNADSTGVDNDVIDSII